MAFVGGRSRRRRIRGWPLMAATALMAASAAVAAPAAGAATTGPHGNPGAGTANAKVTRVQRATVRHASMSSSAAATGDLSTVLSETVHGGYVAAGTGLRNLGYGTISITGIPAGATVKSATLLWDILADSSDSSFAQGTLNGKAFTGTQWASGISPCWPVGTNFSYEADVTGTVTGNGSYNLAGIATGQSDGADPWTSGSTPPLDEGASLVVVYQRASAPQVTVQIGEGATETELGDSATATLNGFTVGAKPAVTTTYIVADGQLPGNTASFNGTTLPGVGFPGDDPQAVPHYSQGNLWDTVTADVSSYAHPGDTTAAIGVTGYQDCLVWVGQVLSVSTGAHYELDFKLWIPQKAVVDPLNATGSMPYEEWRALADAGLEPDLTNPNPAIGPFEAGSTCHDPTTTLGGLLTSVRSTFGGDGYAGYGDGTSYRIAAKLSFDWDGSSVSNLTFTPEAGVSHRTIVETTWSLHGSVTRNCVEYHAATATGSATKPTPSTIAVKLSGVVGFLTSPTAFFHAYPSTSWKIAVNPDGSLGITYKSSRFPTTGLKVLVNGHVQGTEIVNDASCYSQSSLLGWTAPLRIGELFLRTAKGTLPAITPSGPAVNTDRRSPGC